ncbi:hypothetical protein BCR44DRAFT_51191 [Catenaria anguillulae PL171]|uniref:Uncharacterized protein n=1 Tax=Catenaria anguillulae PL171 TaxID=765915 RepID=A0A1Y2I3I2_9FUNG|nr:hypothetical protein BCR44DRAFT_51191 [Catenaria anguillulae PL171]
MYSPAAATMLAVRPAAATAAAAAAAASRRTIATSALAQQSSSSLNSLKNSFWDALSGKSPKSKPQKDASASSSSPPSDQASARGGRGFARRRPSLMSSSSSESSSSPASKSSDGSSPASDAKDSPTKHRSPAARRGPVAQSATARSRYPEPFIFETFQPPALADINFVDGNPWSRTVPGMRPLPKGELLTEEKAQIIREYVGGDYSAHVAVLPKEVEAKLDHDQKRVLQGAMRVLNANASYKVEDKMTVVATVVEGVTGGQVKRSEVLKK